MPLPPITLLSITLAACSLAPMAHGGETSFAVGFRKVTDNLKASASRGQAEPLRGPAKLEFEDDLVAHSGVWGVRLQPKEPLVFAAEGNLPQRSGIVLAVIRTESLESETAVIGLTLKDGGVLSVSAHREGVTLRRINGKGKSAFLAKGPLAKTSDRAEIAFAYNLDDLRGWLFIDNKEVAAFDLPADLAWGGEVTLGGGEGAVTLSEVEFIEGGKAGADFAKRLGERAPALPPAGPASPWFAEGQPRLALEALEPDTVLTPWEPVKWASPAASVWARRYEFGGGKALVPQIVAEGKALLAGQGIELLAAGSPVAFEPEPKVESQHAGVVVIKRKASGSDIEASLRIEYDGMVWVEVKVPAAAVKDELALSIPFTAEFARYYHYIGAPHRYESQNLRRNSYSGELPASEPMKLPFKTNVWLGNTHAGLSWFAESDENWWPLDRKECIVFEREQDGSGKLRIDLVTGALPGNAPEVLTYRFGFMATPVKPMPKGWRGWSLSAQYDSFKGERRGSHLIYWPDEWRRIFLDPEPSRARNPERTRAKVEADRKDGRRIIPYWSRIHVPVTDGKVVNPDIDAMRKAFSVEPDRPAGSTNDMIRVSASSGWSDYLVWAFDRWNSHLGKVDGWYLDETQPIPNTRAESGGGYTAWDGTRRPTFEFLATRDLMKRVQYLVEKWGRQPAFVIHNSSTYAMPYMSFYQTFLVGEQFNSGYFHPNPEVLPPEDDKTYFYSYVLPMDRLIVEGFWRQWGMPVTCMGQLKNQEELMKNETSARDFLSRTLQVDAIYWPLFIENSGIYGFHRIGQAYGIDREDVTFTPYWENRKITSDHPEVVAGYYENSGGWLVICSNLSRKPQKVTLDITALNATQPPIDAERGETITTDSDGKRLTLEIPRNDYKIIRIIR